MLERVLRLRAKISTYDGSGRVDPVAEMAVGDRILADYPPSPGGIVRKHLKPGDRQIRSGDSLPKRRWCVLAKPSVIFIGARGYGHQNASSHTPELTQRLDVAATVAVDAVALVVHAYVFERRNTGRNVEGVGGEREMPDVGDMARDRRHVHVPQVDCLDRLGLAHEQALVDRGREGGADVEHARARVGRQGPQHPRNLNHSLTQSGTYGRERLFARHQTVNQRFFGERDARVLVTTDELRHVHQLTHPASPRLWEVKSEQPENVSSAGTERHAWAPLWVGLSGRGSP